jgi:hypothetical protein
MPTTYERGELGRVVRRPRKPPPRRNVAVRFLEKVKIQPGGCWPWQGRIEPSGYGGFRHDETNYAHRASYLLFVGPIPEGTEIDHLCERRECVNPDHLEAVPHAENVRRANGRWTSCDVLHPDVETRIGMKGSRQHCLECSRIYEFRRRARARLSS